MKISKSVIEELRKERESNELELLNSIKEQLLSKGEMVVRTWAPEYFFTISHKDWHRIFKTDEYNELKEKK